MKSLLTCIGIFILSLNLTAKSTETIDFDKARALVTATEKENIWRTEIAWQTDLWLARQQAGKSGKPIFIWEMDGHPMGCT